MRSLHPGLRARRQVGQRRTSRSSAPTSRTTSRAAAFQDQAGGKTFAENFLAQNKDVDVLFQVAGLTGNGVLDAACAANIYGIGVDVDQFLSYPNAGPCLLTSAEKHLELAVSDALKAVADSSATPGDKLYDAKNDGIGVSQGHDHGDAWAAGHPGASSTRPSRA